jgi:DNA integrity scanning protein DisA with diadenylate cyclase activity
MASEQKLPINIGGLFFLYYIYAMKIHIPHPRIEERSKIGPHLTEDEHFGFNGRLAMLITNMVSTMWCAYLFAIIALISLPAAIEGGTATIVSWVAQTFLQLVLLSVIMVGQKVAARASDKQALQTFKDTEALLKIQDEVHRLIKINTELTEEIHSFVTKQKRKKSI